MKRIYKLQLILLGFLIFNSSCNKNRIAQNTQNSEIAKAELNVENAKALSEIKIVNGTMVFKDDEHFNDCRNQLSKMSQNEVENWVNSLGFKSQMELFNNFQKDMFELEKKFPDIESSQSIYQEYVNELQPIKLKYAGEIEIDENGNVFKKGWIDPNTCWLSNSIHTYKIGTKLVYNDDEINIQILDGSIAKLNQAKASKTTNESIGLYVSKIEKTLLEKRVRANYVSTASWGANGNSYIINKNLNWNSAEGNNGPNNSRRKTSIYLYLFAVASFPTGSVTHNLVVDGFNQRRTNLAGWASTSATNTVSGSYYTNTTTILGSAVAHYYQHTPWAPFYTVHNLPPSTSYGTTHSEAFGYKSISGNGSALSYNFSGSFTVTGSHNNGVSVSVSL